MSIQREAAVSKDQMLNARITARDLDALKRAAELAGVSTSAFVTRAALREAELTLAQQDRTVMPREMFDAVIASLDIADDAPRLRAAAARHTP